MLKNTVKLGIWIGLLCACQDYRFQDITTASFSEKRLLHTLTVSRDVDVLFVIDNSGSMAGEQVQLATSFARFAQVLDEAFGPDKYRIAVVTTGVESPGCPACDPDAGILGSCVNQTGESGAFQDRRGRIVDMDSEPPAFAFTSDPTCRVIDGSNRSCFYDAGRDDGVVLVGVEGCGYERGLAAVHRALGSEGLKEQIHSFLRPEAYLAVVVVSDEEDCGEVGDVSEGIPEVGGNICYYAARGAGPAGETVHPDDLDQRPYALTPVEKTYDFLNGLKGDRPDMVKFAAIVGLADADDPGSTAIAFSGPEGGVATVCRTPGCSGAYCEAYPGTRYVQLARMYGIRQDGHTQPNGFVDTICQADFSETLKNVGEFIACPRRFDLPEALVDPDLASVLVNDEVVPTYSCTAPSLGQPCAGPGDALCGPGSECIRSWFYEPPVPDSVAGSHGSIRFAEHFDPCLQFDSGAAVRIEVVYVAE